MLTYRIFSTYVANNAKILVIIEHHIELYLWLFSLPFIAKVFINEIPLFFRMQLIEPSKINPLQDNKNLQHYHIFVNFK